MIESRPNVHALIRVEGKVSPTEDPKKVLKAMQNILGECSYEVNVGSELITISTEDLDCLNKIHDQLRDRKVRGVARRLAMENKLNDQITFLLNRQAALQGLVVLCSESSESPLGPIILRIQSDEIDSIIEWLTSFESG